MKVKVGDLVHHVDDLHAAHENTLGIVLDWVKTPEYRFLFKVHWFNMGNRTFISDNGLWPEKRIMSIESYQIIKEKYR